MNSLRRTRNLTPDLTRGLVSFAAQATGEVITSTFDQVTDKNTQERTRRNTKQNNTTAVP